MLVKDILMARKEIVGKLLCVKEIYLSYLCHEVRIDLVPSRRSESAECCSRVGVQPLVFASVK
jgi:hypothetical protein